MARFAIVNLTTQQVENVIEYDEQEAYLQLPVTRVAVKSEQAQIGDSYQDGVIIPAPQPEQPEESPAVQEPAEEDQQAQDNTGEEAAPTE